MVSEPLLFLCSLVRCVLMLTSDNPCILLLPAWAKSGRTESVSRAEALLQIMEKSDKVSPDLLSYSGVISSIANSNRAADVAKAEGILDLLTDGNNDVEPDNGKWRPQVTLYFCL